MTEITWTGLPWVHGTGQVHVCSIRWRASLPVKGKFSRKRVSVFGRRGAASSQKNSGASYVEGDGRVPYGSEAKGVQRYVGVIHSLTRCLLMAVLALLVAPIATATPDEEWSASNGRVQNTEAYLESEQFDLNVQNPGGQENGLLDNVRESEAPWGVSLLQEKNRSPVLSDKFTRFVLCDSGIFMLYNGDQKTGVVPAESRNCWQLCRYMEDKHYDSCVLAESPEDCFKQQFAQDSMVPQHYRAACKFWDTKKKVPLFARTQPESNACLSFAMETWRRTESWAEIESYNRRDCKFVKWDPGAPPEPASLVAYIGNKASMWTSALAATQFMEYYVISRDAGLFSPMSADYLSNTESSIVPASFWKARSRKGNWNVLQKFVSPTQHDLFLSLTSDDTGTNSAASICLFEASSGARLDAKFGMLPGTEECDGKIGVLRVAALSAVPAAASVNRQTGYNLCVARRWVETVRPRKIRRVEEMQRVALNSNCASTLSPFRHNALKTQAAGEWEQYFLARLYPLTKGMSSVPDSAICPWKKSMQYGLKCFAAIESGSSAYVTSFPEFQLACRRLALGAGVPSNFSRLAVMQSDEDFRLLQFIAPLGSTAWIGIYQRNQYQLSASTYDAKKSRIPETSCPDHILTPPGKPFSRMSALKPLCEASGALIDQPKWESLWTENDGDLTTPTSWDIPWCAGHPQTMSNARFVDCAALRTGADGTSCVVSAPCDNVLPGFCSFPVYYPPRVTGATNKYDGVQLSPRVRCSHAACTVQVDLSRKADTVSPGQSVYFLGVPFPLEALVGLKRTCSSVTSMMGPYKLTQEIDLASSELFRKLDPGVYELCYCSLVPHGATTGSADSRCESASDFYQLLATIVLEDGQAVAASEKAIRVPPAVLASPSSVSFAIDVGRSKMFAETIVSCTWNAGSASEACLFYLKAADGVETGASTHFTLRFVPIDSDVDSKEICKSKNATRTTGDISVNAAVSVPLKRPTETFYAICQDKGEYLGGLFFPESAIEPSRPKSSIKLTFPSKSLTRPVVTVTIQGTVSHIPAQISYIVVLPAQGPEDEDCSWNRLQSQNKQEYRNPTTLPDGWLSFSVEPLAGFSKICYVAEVAASGNKRRTQESGLVDVLPSSSKMFPLRPVDSRCFAVPNAAPCQIDVVPEPVSDVNNPHGLDPFFSPNMRLYATPGNVGCPPDVTNLMYAGFTGDENDTAAVENARSVPLRDMGSVGFKTTFMLPQAFKPWLKRHRIAMLCWLYSQPANPSACPSGMPCATAVGRLYWVEAVTASAESYKVFCSYLNDAGCLLRVEGVNMNLFDMSQTRLAAVYSCTSNIGGLGLVQLNGKYHNHPLVDGQTSAFLLGQTAGTPPPHTAGGGASLLDLRENATYTTVDYMDFSSSTSAMLPYAFNSTAIYFKLETQFESTMLELCFNGAEKPTADTTQFSQKVGYVAFPPRLLKAGLSHLQPQYLSVGMYEVSLVVKGYETSDIDSRSFIYHKKIGVDQKRANGCDYESDKSDTIYNKEAPFLVTNIGTHEVQAQYQQPQANQLVVYCWTFEFSTASSQKHAWTTFLLGYNAGPSFPNLSTSPPFCSGQSLSQGCGIILVADGGRPALTGGFFFESSTYLSNTGLVVLLFNGASTCPIDPAGNEYTAQHSDSYALLRTATDVARQELSVSDEALSRLALVGSGRLCYAVQDCVPVSGKAMCTKDLGFLRWIGPTQQPDVVLVCNRIEINGCVVTITGFALDILDYTVPLLAVKHTCAAPRVQRTAMLLRRPSGGSQQLLGEMSVQPKRPPNWDGIPHTGNTTSAVFLVTYLPASVQELCWNVTGQLSETSAAGKASFRFFLKKIIFLPHPKVIAINWITDPDNGVTMELKINALIETSFLQSPPLDKIQIHYLYVLVDGNAGCSSASAASAVRHSYARSSTRSVPMHLRLTESYGKPGFTEAKDATHTKMIETVDLDYELRLHPDPIKLCWHSMFYDESGKQIHEHHEHLDSVTGASPAVLDALSHPEGDIARCGHTGDPNDCSVTITGANSSHQAPALLPATSRVFLLRGDVSCPTTVDDQILTSADDASQGSIHEHSSAVKMRRGKWQAQPHAVTFAYPVIDKLWMSTSIVASICWAYGSKNDCPASTQKPCVVKLGNMYWQGPTESADPNIITCNSASGCKVPIKGTNLHKLERLYNRVALLDTCGSQGGLGLLEATRLPESYLQQQPSPLPPLENHFKPDTKDLQGLFFVHNDQSVELNCPANTSLSIQEAKWKVEGEALSYLCQELDVALEVNEWCNNTHACVVHPLVSTGSESTNASLTQGGRILLPHPCMITPRTPTLSGIYTCENLVSRKAAFVENQSDATARARVASEPWSAAPQQVTFSVKPWRPSLYHICWNPKDTVVLEPEAYTLKLGYVHILPAAGMSAITKSRASPVDKAILIVHIAGLVDVESAKESSVKLVHPEDTLECEAADSRGYPPHGIISFVSQVAGQCTLAYAVPAPDTEMLLCWQWMADSLVSATGMKLMNLVGRVPGASNPEAFGWGRTCGGLTDEVCAIELLPAPVKLSSAAFATDSTKSPAKPAPSYIDTMDGFFSQHYSIYLVVGTEACPTDVQDPMYSSSPPNMRSLRLTWFQTRPATLIAELHRAEKEWLALHSDAFFCWVNTSACGIVGSNPCVAEVGIVSWRGPIPYAWSLSPLRPRCKKDIPCEFVISGRNFFLMDMRSSRVAVLENCGDIAGPGIAEVKKVTFPLTQPKTQAQSTLFQVDASPRGQAPDSIPAFPSTYAGQTSLITCPRNAECGELHLLSLTGSSSSALETQGWTTRNWSRDEVVITSTTIVERRNYVICWNPEASPTENLAAFSLHIGNLEYYGFETTTALCFSGSTCSLSFSAVGVDMNEVEVALKDVDCSDLSLTTSLLDGKFYFKGQGWFELRARIPEGAPEFKTYHMCWCDRRSVRSCLPADYREQIGLLSVQVLPFVSGACPPIADKCTIVIPYAFSVVDPSGQLVLTEDPLNSGDCQTGGGDNVVSAQREGNTMKFVVTPTAAGVKGSVAPPTRLICWRFSAGSPNGETSSQGSRSLSRTPALLGSIRFAGPLKDTLQQSGVVAAVGVSLTVAIGVAGFGKLVDQAIDHSAPASVFPPHWRRLLVVPTGMCGTANASSFSDWIYLSRVISLGIGTELAFYSNNALFSFPPDGVDVLDLCWCGEHFDCSADDHFVKKVIALPVVAPQARVDVVCTYDSRCSFDYEITREEVLYGLDSKLVVADPGCAATSVKLPEKGILVRTHLKMGERRSSDPGQRELVKQAFASPLSRSAIFQDFKRSRTFAICFCANSKNNCVEQLLEVGTLVVYDVWEGVSLIIPLEVTRMTVRDPPFTGKNGHMYISGENVALQETGANDPSEPRRFTLDIRKVLEQESPPAFLDLLYCENDNANYCASTKAEHIEIGRLEMLGCAERSWNGMCALGTQCNLTINFFRGALNSRIALLTSCLSPLPSQDYGISNVGVVVSQSGSILTMSFSWDTTLSDSAHPSLEACWCVSLGGACFTVYDYMIKVGTVDVAGLRKNQPRECRVGTVCEALDLEGYNLGPNTALMIVETGCGAAAQQIQTLPRQGHFAIKKAAKEKISFTLEEKLLGLPPTVAHMCQCPALNAPCKDISEFSWFVGAYAFMGPAEIVISKDATSGVGSAFKLAFRSNIDLTRDFLNMDFSKDCRHTTPFDPPLPRNGWLPLTSAGTIDTSQYPFLLRGNVYFICYCRAEANIVSPEANNDPFHEGGAAPSEGACNITSAYKVLVGILIVTGPHELNRDYICTAGGHCEIDVIATSSATEGAENVLGTSEIHLKQASCADPTPLATATVQKWEYESDYTVDYENIVVKTVRQKFSFKTQMQLPAGIYVTCWQASAPSSAPLEVGRMHITGPQRESVVVKVWSGRKFNIGVKYAGSSNPATLQEARLRIVPYPNSVSTSMAISCPDMPWTRGDSAAFGYLNLHRPPDTVQAYDPLSSRALWENIIIVVDARTPDIRPGAYFAVCFCDGNAADCGLENNYFVQVATIRVVGPYPSDLNYPLQLGRVLKYTMMGLELPYENYIMILPAIDLATHQPYSCGQAGTEKSFPPFLGLRENAAEPDKIFFKGVYISASSPAVTVCWCGGPGCSVGSDFLAEIGVIPVDCPHMDEVAIIPEGIFSIVLRGHTVLFGDRITVVDPDKACGEEDTERMNSLLVTIPPHSPSTKLDDLGKGQQIKDLPPVNGKSSWMWSSWPIQATAEATKSLKVCYCSVSEGACVGQYRFNSWIGSVTVLGPFKGSLKLTILPHLHQQVELTGNALSMTNKLKYFMTHKSKVTVGGDLRGLCSDNPDSEATIVTPERVADDGTSQRFAVSMSSGYHYILCWSFGSPSPTDTKTGSTIEEATSETAVVASTPAAVVTPATPSPPPQSADGKQAPRKKSFFDVVDDLVLSPGFAYLQNSVAFKDAQDPLMAPGSRLRWNFLTDIVPSGFRAGQVFTAVVSMDDLLMVRGSPNTTDTYTAYVGEESRGRYCDALQADPFMTITDIMEVTEHHISFRLPHFQKTGLYPVCVKNVGLDHLFDVGVIKVEDFYWKSLYEVLGRSRLVMFPCFSKGLPDAAGAYENNFFMPDGMGAWTAKLDFIKAGDEGGTQIPVLNWAEDLGSRWVEFYNQGLRSIVACASDENQQVYHLGPSKLVIQTITPAASSDTPPTRGLQTMPHSSPTPIDITVKHPYIFISDYQSPMITVVSSEDTTFLWQFFPTEPSLLFAAGIQVLEIADKKTALGVTDMINHIVGLIHVDLDQFPQGAQTEVHGTPWHSYFGRPKVPLHNAQGLSYPFTLGCYMPTSSAAASVAGQAKSLLMVGELLSERVVFLEPREKSLEFYRQILIPERLMMTGLRVIEDYLFLASRDWFKDADMGESNSYVSIMKLADLVESHYFTYPDFRTKFQSGLRYSFMPIISGPPIHFFKEDAANSNLAALGLHLNPQTGEISGLISHTGQFQVSIIGGDLLGSYTWTLSGEAGCRAGDYYNTEHAACEACPVGTFRDQEAELQLCEVHKPNSSTLSVGSTQLAQCHCIAGFEIGTLGACTPCPAGTYKASISDSNCTGKCPANMRSHMVGAGSEEMLQCQCTGVPPHKPLQGFPVDHLCAALGQPSCSDSGYFMEGDTCKPCPIGAYCTGDLSPPIKCPDNRTTSGLVAKGPDECECMPGYTLEASMCVQCSRLTYKSGVGNEPCTPCPQPAGLSDTGTIILASTRREEAEFTPEKGATSLQECRLCASGFFVDSASGGCMPCTKNSFCPGRDLPAKSCGENALTVYEGAETPFACKCPKGYGRLGERNPVDFTIVCVECPRNTFQHIEGTDTECIPCPTTTVTKTTKSTTLTACAASPGYFFAEKLEQILTGVSAVVDSPTAEGEEDVTVLTRMVNPAAAGEALVDFSSLRLAESQYEVMTSESFNVPRYCIEGDSILAKTSPEIKMIYHAEDLAHCIRACVRNVYCTSMTFRHGSAADPSFATTITNHAGVYVRMRWPCELHVYGKELLEEDMQALRHTAQHKPEGQVVSCIIDRPDTGSLWRRITYQECPMNAYCPGDKEAQIYECPSSSVTVVPRASSVDQCKCIPGYRSVAGQCEPCRIGTYKNTTSNLSCTECPSSFTTAAVASISAYDCVCLPGLYIKMEEKVDGKASPSFGPLDADKAGTESSVFPPAEKAHVEPEPAVTPTDQIDEAEPEEYDEGTEEGETGEAFEPGDVDESDDLEEAYDRAEADDMGGKEDAGEADEVRQTGEVRAERDARDTIDAEESSSAGKLSRAGGEISAGDDVDAGKPGNVVEADKVDPDGMISGGDVPSEGKGADEKLRGTLKHDKSAGEAENKLPGEQLPPGPVVQSGESFEASPASKADSSSFLQIKEKGGNRRARRKTSTRQPQDAFGMVNISPTVDIPSAVELHGELLVRADRGKVSSLVHMEASGRGGLAGLIFIPNQGSSLLDWAKPRWLEKEMRHELEKVVKLHHCTSCYKQMYCPGLWLDPPLNHTHMPPQLCPEGSNVPSSTVIADSIEKCLCLPGYSYVGGGGDDKSLTMGCKKCASGAYKELQENSPCAGRCMKDAETFEGAVAKIQCFCKVGKYAMESKGTDALFTCHDCVQGGVCPGGFKKRVREGIEADHNFVDISIHDHQVPFPSKGFFAVYKTRSEAPWSPRMVPMSANFTGDTFREAADMEVDFFDQTTLDVPGFLDISDAQAADQAILLRNASDSAMQLEDSFTPRSYFFLQHGGVYRQKRLSRKKTPAAGRTGFMQMGHEKVPPNANTALNLHYERIPDIHACFEDRRCNGGPHNMCSKGSAGYLCSACEPGYATTWYRSMCTTCFSLWAELLSFVSIRAVVCLIVWLLAALSIVAAEQRACVHPVLLRILISNYFLFSVFGLMPETSVSTLFEWAPLYRTFFFTSYVSSHSYLKLACVLRSVGISPEYRHAWYLQRLFQVLIPLLDVLFITLVSVAGVSLYKLVAASRIHRVRAVLAHARETRGGQFWTECTIRKVENDRCLGMFRYLSASSVFSRSGFKTLLADLIPAYTVIWFWHYPFLVIQFGQLVGCVATSYKKESPIYVLSSMPMQTCKLDNVLFLGGFILGIGGLLVWGVGTIVLLVVWVHQSQDADPIQVRFRRSFLTNGYQVQYRAWEAILTVRKGALALIMTMHLHLNSAGAQEVFQSSANLAISVVYVMMQLIMEPYDKRSHNLANRVEFYGLVAHIVNGVIFQGSYYFDAFKYVGPIPIVVTSLFYIYVVWNLFVEWGRMVIMQPYLARIPSFWRYYNRVTRSLARLYTAGNAKIYYNYITKDMVVEAATKLRVFHIRRLLKGKGHESTYRKINYENRLYFVAALTDSLSQLVIAWCQFTIPGDWLDFTIRYAFCYCFWQRHQGAIKFRVPLDSEEFDSIQPELFSDWYYKREVQEEVDEDDDVFEASEYVCNQAEEELLALMLDDDVYDDSPITLMELYVAVQSMRYIPQLQLRRLHHWYRERIANASNTLIPETRKQNEELKTEIEELNETLRQMTGAQEAPGAPPFSLMDYFFTVEMIHQANLEVDRLQGQLEKLSEDIARERVAQAMATHLMLGLKEEEQQATEKRVETTSLVPSLPVAAPREAKPAMPLLETGKLAVLAAQLREERMDYMAGGDSQKELGVLKVSTKRKLTLPDKRLERAETRRTLQRGVPTPRALTSPGDPQGRAWRLQRPDERNGVPSRRIVLAQKGRPRSVSSIHTAAPRERSISLNKATPSAFQAGAETSSFSSFEGEGDTEMRRRTLTRHHMEPPRESTVSRAERPEEKRTVHLSSGTGIQSRRTLSLSTSGVSGDLSDVSETYLKDTSHRPLGSMSDGSSVPCRAARDGDTPTLDQGRRRRLSPLSVGWRSSEEPQGPPGKPTTPRAESRKGDMVARESGIRRRRVDSGTEERLSPERQFSSSKIEGSEQRRLSAVGADKDPPTFTGRRRRSRASISRPFGEEAACSETSGPQVGRRRIGSPVRKESASGSSSAASEEGQVGEESALREGDDEAAQSSEIGVQHRRRESSSSSSSRPRTLTSGLPKDSTSSGRSTSRRSGPPYKED